jgi:two-component system sensor histidine kinase/response regulator
VRSTLADAVLLAAGRDRAREPGVRALPERTLAPETVTDAAPASLPILVAEDNPVNQKVIAHQLRLMGILGEIVPNGREALERWRRGSYALLLTDLHMPEMDGYELARSIRDEERPPGRIPIVALTANALKEEEARCRAAGIDAYLTKPVPLPRLKAVLTSLLRDSGFT